TGRVPVFGSVPPLGSRPPGCLSISGGLGLGCCSSGGGSSLIDFLSFDFFRSSFQSSFASSRLCRASAFKGSSAAALSSVCSEQARAERSTLMEPPRRSRQVPRLYHALAARSAGHAASSSTRV